MVALDFSNPVEIYQTAARLVDNTCLRPDSTEENMDALATNSMNEEPQAASICINPEYVKYVKAKYPLLCVATVINFPHGQDSTEDVLKSVKQAIADGADELDMVIDYKKIIQDKSEGIRAAESIITAVRALCPHEKVLLKVIIESGELKDPDLIAAVSSAAIDSGADFIKTSTGKSEISATLEAATIMLQCIKKWHVEHPESTRIIGFKPAGGIYTAEQAKQYLQVAECICGPGWVSKDTFRFGASSLLGALRTALSEESVEINHG